MPSKLPPIDVGGVPSFQGLWTRAYLLELLSFAQYDTMRRLAESYGPVMRWTQRNIPAVWEPTFVTWRMDSSLYVAIQGTENLKQVLLHIGGVANTYTAPLHDIFNRRWLQVADSMFDQLAGDGSLDGVSEVDLFGHSYGAAVAGLLAMRLTFEQPSLRVVVATYGSPRAHGGVWHHPLPQSWVRVAKEHDVVPLLPPSRVGTTPSSVVAPLEHLVSDAPPWQHDGYGVTLNDDGTDTQGTPDGYEAALTWAMGYSTWERSHAVAFYRAALQRAGLVVIPDLGSPPPDPVSVQPDPPVSASLEAPSLVQADLDALNQLYYGSTAGPITSTNVETFESVSLLAGGHGNAPTPNISGGTMASAPSGYTKFTLCINNGTFGKLESHVFKVNYNDPGVQGLARTLAGNRMHTLGCDSTTPVIGKSGGTPIIEFVKVQDAVSPKMGSLVDLRGAGFSGQEWGNAYPADHFAIGLNVRMIGQQKAVPTSPTTTVPPNQQNVNLQLVGQPDDAVKHAVFDPTFVRVSGQNYLFIGDVKNYVSFLVGQGLSDPAGWGFMGLSSLEQKYAMTYIPPAAGSGDTTVWFGPVPTPNAPSPPWATGDRVRLTAGNPSYNGTFSIIVGSGPGGTGAVSLKKPPAVGQPIPKTCFMQRISSATATGTLAPGKTLTFYKYTGFQTNGDSYGNPQVAASRHIPGRQFLGVSFRKRIRRPR